MGDATDPMFANFVFLSSGKMLNVHCQRTARCSNLIINLFCPVFIYTITHAGVGDDVHFRIDCTLLVTNQVSVLACYYTPFTFTQVGPNDMGCVDYTQKVCFFLYNAVSTPLDRSKSFTLFALPGRPVHSDTNSVSPGSILVMQQLRATTKSLTFPPLSIAFTHLCS